MKHQNERSSPSPKRQRRWEIITSSFVFKATGTGAKQLLYFAVALGCDVPILESLFYIVWGSWHVSLPETQDDLKKFDENLGEEIENFIGEIVSGCLPDWQRHQLGRLPFLKGRWTNRPKYLEFHSHLIDASKGRLVGVYTNKRSLEIVWRLPSFEVVSITRMVDSGGRIAVSQIFGFGGDSFLTYLKKLIKDACDVANA